MYLSNVRGSTYDGRRITRDPQPTTTSTRTQTYLEDLANQRTANQANSIQQTREQFQGTPQSATQNPSTTTTNPYEKFGDVANYKTQYTDYNPNGATQGLNFDPSKSPLSDINNYIGNSNPFRAWRTSDGGFDEVQFNTYNSYNGVPLYRKTADGGWEINPEGRLGELNKQFPGLNFALENDPYADDYQDGRPSYQLKWDNSVLPQDKFGRQGTSVDPIGYEDGRNGTMLIPQAVYDDPFYGRITDPRNLRQHQDWFDQFNEMLLGTPMLVSLAAGGLGAAIAPAAAAAGLAAGISPSTALAGMQVISSLVQGKLTLESAIPMLISMGFSLSGANAFLGKMAPLLRSGVNYGVGQLTNRGN